MMEIVIGHLAYLSRLPGLGVLRGKHVGRWDHPAHLVRHDRHLFPFLEGQWIVSELKRVILSIEYRLVTKMAR